MLAAVLSACGFSPRGSVSGGEEVGAIFIDSTRDVSIAPLLQEKMSEQGLQIATDREQANVLVRLSRESRGRRVLSVQSQGKVSEYELRHAIDMLVIKATGEEFARYSPGLKPNRVAVRREYTFDDTGVLGKEDEASILKREMRDELARTLLLRIIAGR